MKLLASTHAAAAGPAKPDQRIARDSADFAPDMRPRGGLAPGLALKTPISARGAEIRRYRPMLGHANAPASVCRRRFLPALFPNPDRHDV
jgi:hypothetical protein